MTTTSAVEKMKDTAISSRDLLTIMIDGQIFGIPVLQVQDVLGPQKITRVPLAPPAIAGALNLRGRIVTAIDMRACLSMPPREGNGKEMSVVIDHEGELFSLLFDRVGDVLSLPYSDYEKSPGTLDPAWRDMCSGIYRLKGQLLVVLDIPRLLGKMESKKEIE